MHFRSTRAATAAAGLALALLSLSACSSTKVVRAPVEATVGQQLIELKSAFDNGAMNRREYDQQRRRLIDSVK